MISRKPLSGRAGAEARRFVSAPATGVAQEPPFIATLLLHGCAGGLFDHLGYDIRLRDRDGM